MRFCPHLSLTTVFLLVLTSHAGWSAMPTPFETTPGQQPLTVTSITTATIAFKGPTVTDITTSAIAFQGPTLTDITTGKIHFSGKALAIELETGVANLQPTQEFSPVLRIVGVEPGLELLSPQAGQKIIGNVPLEVNITGWRGVPQVQLDWWWSPPTAAGKWPEEPQGMTIVDGLDGKSKIVISQSAFPKEGQWRVKATVKVTDTLDVSDDVTFTLVKNLAKLGKKKSKQLMVKPSVAKPMLSKVALIPMIVSPRENQRVAAPGTVSVKARWKVGDFSLLWEVAHKPFGKSRFTPHTLKPTASPSTGNTVYSGKLKLTYPGYYRLRVKTDSPGARWSQWRTIVVGAPSPAKPSRGRSTLQKKPALKATSTSSPKMSTDGDTIRKTSTTPQLRPAPVENNRPTVKPTIQPAQ